MKKTNKRILLYFTTAGLAFTTVACQQETTTTPTRRNIEDAVFANGYIEHENSYTIAANVEGILVALSIKEGDCISKNDLIALVENDVPKNNLQDAQVVYQDALKNAAPNSPQLQHIKAQIDQAKVQLEYDRENYLRYRELRAKNSVSQLDYEKAELQFKAAQNNLLALEKNYHELKNGLDLQVERSKVQVNTQQALLKDYKLFAVEGGQVIHVFKKQGELARRGEAIAKIGSGSYIIKLFVAEDDIVKINIGQLVAVNINTYPANTFSAKVTKIYPGFDENEQSYIIEAQFENLPEKMFSGTQLQANIKIGGRDNVLVIPSTYVSKGNYVTLESGEQIQIEAGIKNNSWTEVISGLSEQEVIIKTNN